MIQSIHNRGDVVIFNQSNIKAPESIFGAFCIHTMDDTQVQAQRDSKGRMLAPLPGSHVITKADASSLARKRWEKYRQAAVKRIVGEAQSIDPDVQTPADAFGLVAAKQYTTLMDSDKPRITDLEKLGQIMTGISEEPRRENTPGASNSITGSPEALLRLVELIEADKRQAVDQARAVDADSTDIRNE
jgi:hypothetical protein